MADVFHEGELAIQELAGVRDEAARVGPMVAPTIPVRALAFLEAQAMLVIASVDADGQPWVSLLTGEPGFARSRDGARLDIDLRAARADDPLSRNLVASPQVGVLAIELATRRRLRINGTATLGGRHTLSLRVSEAYPNCPKYIQRRNFELGAAASPRPDRRGAKLGPEQVALIGASDTMFVASRHPVRGCDASHRGGIPGFVRVTGPTTLRVPDYAGNTMFNTLGNLAVEPRAGLLVLDFGGRRMLELVGTTTTHYAPTAATGHTGLSWDFELRSFRELDLPSILVVSSCEASPFNPPS